MRRAVLLVIAGCGRLQFDALSDASSTRPADATSDLVVHYTMDSLAGMSVPDSGDNHLDAACTSCPTQDVGVLGGALRFDGTSTIVSATSPLFDQATEYTVAFWARRDQLPANASCMVSKRYGTGMGNSWQICINSIGVVFYANWNGTINEDTTPGNAVDGAWHHLAITFAAPSETLYLDGAQISRVPRAKVFDGGAVVIGADIDNGAPLAFYSGWIDDIRIYNRPLSATEIAALAQ